MMRWNAKKNFCPKKHLSSKMSKCTGVTLAGSNDQYKVYVLRYPQGGKTWIVCKPQNLRSKIYEDLVKRSCRGKWSSLKNGNTIMLSQSCSKTPVSKPKSSNNICPLLINSRTNYLQVLDFYVHFDLDEGFNETIRSRHRDAFSYSSFSEGEKQRIDLALLFTWRHVAKMKNSVATNLLILDETFDSSLDADGVENLLKILETLDANTNIFVISHKGELLETKFENKIEVTKTKNFSTIL